MDKDALDRWLDQGRSLEWIGRETNLHASTVAYWVRKHGLEPVAGDAHGARGAPPRDVLARLVAEGRTVREIALAIDRSPTTVRHWLKRYGLATMRAARLRSSVPGPVGERYVDRCYRHGEATFIVRPDGASGRCSRCRMEAVSEWRRRVKQRLVERAGGCCSLCGYDRCVAALQFHHVDPTEKRFSISNRGLGVAWATLSAEADKCVLLCGNCHAEVEAGVATLP